jgi:hypothetical protein
MTSHDDVPYADSESLPQLIEECRCLEQECASHGVGLHVAHHHDTSRHPVPIVIGEGTRHALDGYPEYGT